MITKQRKLFGQRYTSRPFQDRIEIIQRPITCIRILKKAPYKVTYADFTYSIQAVELTDEKTSYIAAQMVTANGRLCQPLHEYELTRRFPTLTGAGEAWTSGFEAKGDEFVSRAIIERMIDEEAAEIIPAPEKLIPLATPEPPSTSESLQ